VSTPKIRPPAVAGTFYPRDAAALGCALESAHRQAAVAAGPVPKALIVPHAGYVYSGPIAASAYRLLAPLRFRTRRVVLLGPSHRVALRGLATTTADFFRTPLGDVAVDRAAVERAARLPQVSVQDAAHEREHSLEVQLPFLQRALESFALAPFAVGDATDLEVAEVLELLWGGDETLIVVSSDLSHYHDYRTARGLDAATCAAIEALDPRSLDEESACGRVAIRGLLVAARRHGLSARALDLRSSGDTAGERDEVVGYGAFALA
jgi:AmmeMemoRadiSam system protein B